MKRKKLQNVTTNPLEQYIVALKGSLGPLLAGILHVGFGVYDLIKGGMAIANPAAGATSHAVKTGVEEGAHKASENLLVTIEHFFKKNR